MRTTDDLNPQQPWQPLGEKVVKTPPPAPEQKPRGDYGIVTDENGRLRTTRDPQTQVR